MRRSAVLVLVILAGCAATPSPPPLVTTSDDVVTGEVGDCPLTYPDGAPMPCDIQEWVDATSSSRPALADGWRCTATWGEDGLLTEQYMTPEGRIGFYWEWERWKPDGLAFQRFAWYTGMEEGMSYHIPYQPTGFFAMPGTPSPDGPVEVQETVRLLRIHAKIDGQWMQDPPNATFLLTHVGGDWWWTARFDWPGGPYFVNTMHEDMEEGQLGKWQGASWRGTIAGTEVLIDSTGNGIKYVNFDHARQRTAVANCGLVADASA